MSKFDEFWVRMTRANPVLRAADDERISVSVGGLKKLTHKAHDDGFKTAQALLRNLESIRDQSLEDGFTDLFRKDDK